MRHIILEGMDGSGKSTLLAQLISAFPDHTPHERASTSLGGPVDNLMQWVEKDVLTMDTQPPSLYDRHPLVSEPIYAPVRGINQGLTGVWSSPEWIYAYRRLAALHSVLVVCQPPFHTVQENLMRSGAQAHMPGVMENRLRLYNEYLKLNWPGRYIRYDYTKDSVETLVRLLGKVIH